MLKKSEVGNTLKEILYISERYINLAENNYITVALAGEFSAGKSTLINALLEEEILPSGDRPLTSINVQIKHSEKSYIRITWNKELTPIRRRIFLAKYAYWLRSWRQFNLISPQCELFCESVKVSKIREFLKNLEEERKTANVYAADSIEIGIPFPKQWRQVRFIDVPGSGAITSKQELIQASYKEWYVLLYVIDAQHIGSKLSEELIQKYSQQDSKQLVIINKWDTIPKKEQQAKLNEVKECYGVEAVPFAALSYLDSRLVATKQLKVKDIIAAGKLNLNAPMSSPSWNSGNMEANAAYLADYLQKRSNYEQFSNVLKHTFNGHGKWNTTQYKKKIQTLITTYENRLTSLNADVEDKASERNRLIDEQKREYNLRTSIETACNDSVNKFKKELRNASDKAKNHLRERAKVFAEDELKKNAKGNWNVISLNDYISHYSWNDTKNMHAFLAELYKINQRSINALNTQFTALDNSIPKLYTCLDSRQFEHNLKEIITDTKKRLHNSLHIIASDQKGYPGFLAAIFTDAKQRYVDNKRKRFHAAIDSITSQDFNELNGELLIASYSKSLHPIEQFTARIRNKEETRQRQINTLQREIEAAQDELNMWQCDEYAATMIMLKSLLSTGSDTNSIHPEVVAAITAAVEVTIGNESHFLNNKPVYTA